MPTAVIQYTVDLLDSWGAVSWSLRAVASTTAAVLLATRRLVGTAGGIEWHALIHALVTGLGAVFCQVLDSSLSGESLGPCSGPPTSLHRLLPALTLGYSICDIIDSFKLGPAFLLHGLATATIMAIFCELDGASHVVTPMLLMELSTIPLTTVRARFYSEAMRLSVQLVFVLVFFTVRILWVPWIWLGILKTMNEENCYPTFLLPIVFMVGTFFHCLNGYCEYCVRVQVYKRC